MAAATHLSEADVRQIVGADAEIVTVSTPRVACNGDGGALGHPKVFYNIGDKGYVECGYCDRVFILGAPD